MKLGDIYAWARYNSNFDFTLTYKGLAPTSPGFYLFELDGPYMYNNDFMFRISEFTEELNRGHIKFTGHDHAWDTTKVTGLDNKHKDHEVVNSIANNKEFKYCRTCKVEV